MLGMFTTCLVGRREVGQISSLAKKRPEQKKRKEQKIANAANPSRATLCSLLEDQIIQGQPLGIEIK